MPYIFAANSSGTGVKYDLGDTNSLKVPVNVSITSDDSSAIFGTGVGIDISVFGYVGAGLYAISLSTSGGASATGRTVRIGANGILDGGNTGINDFGSGDRIFNSGQIYGHQGVNFGSSAQSATGTLYNFGTIEASTAVLSSSPALKIYNYGKIDGVEGDAVLTAFGDDLLYNRGTINGDVLLGDGNNRLLNHGLIAGDITLGSGNDTFDNRGGTVEGSAYLREGNDTFLPGASSETVDGGTGENTLDFSKSSGVHFALDGSIDATGWAWGDTYTNFQDLLGSVTGNDILTGDGGANVIAGFGGNDTLSGQGGNDTLVGGRGNDTLNGGTGDDILKGEDGNDILIGGPGYDILTGGTGADKFVFAQGDIQNSGTGAFEKITDFSEADQDKVDLSAIDANTLVAGDQAFVFIGYAAFHKVAGELRVEHFVGADVISGDTNGDGTADFYLSFVGVTSLVAGDFVL